MTSQTSSATRESANLEAQHSFSDRISRPSRSLEQLRRFSRSLQQTSAQSLGIPHKSDPPPNGGWGWIVVLSAFLIHLNVLGLQYSFGVIYKALRDDPTLEGGGSRAASAIAGSIASSLMLLFSLPAGILVKRFGPRPVSSCGAILISLGLWLSSLTSDLRVLYITYGIISGIGYGLCWAPSVMAVNMYFTSRRALASGVAVAGSGVGTVVYANVCNALIAQLGWRGALFQLALIAGACNLLSASSFFPVGKDADEAASSQPNHEQQDTADSAAADTGEVALLSSDGLAIAREAGEEKEITVALAADKDGNCNACSDTVPPFPPPPAVLDLEAVGGVPSGGRLTAGEDAPKRSRDEKRGEPAAHAPMTLREMLHSRAMQIIGATMFVYAGSIWIPYTFLVSYAQSEGGVAPEQAANLVAVIGAASTAGRVVIGAVSDQLGIRRLLHASMLLTGTALLVLAALPPSLPLLLLFSAVFGAFAGSVVAMIGPLLVEQLGIRNLPTAFGLAAALQAPAVVLGPPLGGWLRDVSGAYLWTWLLPGALLCLVSFCLVLLPRSPASSAAAR